MTHKALFPLLLMMLFLASCQSSKQAAVADLRSLTTEIEQNASSYNFKQWVAEQRKFQKIDARLQQYDYTEAENREIGELKGRCLGYFARGVLGKASNKIVDAANQLQGIVDGIQKVLLP